MTISPEFFFNFLFLAISSWVLLSSKLSDRLFGKLLFAGSAVYTYLFYEKYIRVFSMAGDNICQIAYWKILFHPNLTGSIGAAYTKPGQILILGPLYELSSIFGENIFGIGICLAMASCIWILARIAADLGGREAGVAALPLSFVAFQPEFLAGSYSIFMVPAIFSGLRLYYLSPRRALGRALLALSIQFHILSAPILAVIWIELFKEKNWSELRKFTMACAGSLALWLLIILRVQGSLARISSSGPAAGYIGSIGDSFVYRNTAEYIFKSVWSELSGSYTYIALFILMGIGIIGVWHLKQRHYLAIFSIPLLLIANVILFNGTLNINRYFAVLYGFGCGAGIGSLVRFARDRAWKPSPILESRFAGRFVLIILIAAATAIGAMQFRKPDVPPYVISAKKLLADPFLPAGTRLMAEDDLLYPLVTLAPAHYARLAALQQFNTADDVHRRAILGAIDLIWIDLTGQHQYYYLDYLPIPAWRHDPFRRMINGIIASRTAGSLYGFRFTPEKISREGLLLRVSPETADSQ